MTAHEAASNPLRVFIGFAEEDRSFKDELLKHLTLFEQLGHVETWSVDDVYAGDDWKKALGVAVHKSDVTILLISVDFLATTFAQDASLPQILSQLAATGRSVVPVIVRSCLWQHHPWIGALKPLPLTGEAIAASDGNAREHLLAEVAAAIVRARPSDSLRTKLPPSMQAQVTESAEAADDEQGRGARPYGLLRANRVSLRLLGGVTLLAATVATLVKLSRLDSGIAAAPDHHQAGCAPDRQLYDGVCVSNRMVDYLECLRNCGAINALHEATAAAQKHGTNASGNADSAVLSDVGSSFRTLSEAERRHIIDSCKEAARSAGLAANILAPPTSSVPSPPGTQCAQVFEKCSADRPCCPNMRCQQNLCVYVPKPKSTNADDIYDP
ncbi:MAG: TIR domain-containing protein [Polyangiaceae bacterium]|nr:TIR domain-containing protein [Polyangiaceae bacterium]